MILECGREPCPEHDNLCAYHGDEQGLCPYCHQSWETIITTNGPHACERFNTWPANIRKERVKTVTIMRHLAERIPAAERREIRDRAVFCAHAGILLVAGAGAPGHDLAGG